MSAHTNNKQQQNSLRPSLNSLGNVSKPPSAKKQGGKAKGKMTLPTRSRMMSQTQIAPLASITILRQSVQQRPIARTQL